MFNFIILLNNVLILKKITEMTLNKRVYPRICAYDGVVFNGAKPFSKFCCAKCRVYYSQEKKAYEESVREQLPQLLRSVKKRVDEILKDKTPHIKSKTKELESAITIILNAQKELDGIGVALKSFDEFLKEKRKKSKR